MPNQANTGTLVTGVDTGHSPPTLPFSAPIIASGTVFAGTTNAAKLGDRVLNTDGHSGTIVSGSSTVFVGTMVAARLGDTVSGTLNGTIVGGESTIQTG